MAQNFFEDLQAKKKALKDLATKAKSFGWIDESREQEIINKLDNDVLTIGVIGQMKCGKSTFLNSFVFQDDVLPAATTPMTAALSVITYDEKERIEAEFYSKDEWEEQKLQAARSLDDVRGDSLEESKVKAAKELVARSSVIASILPSLLGSSKADSLSNLIEYVGAEGKYVSITKSVKIFYPKEYLKGIEIVDTPGFNDPIVSREERTKDFLRKADVVLMMLYAGRPFDSTDRDILFKNVQQCGIGKVLVGINKYDIPACDPKHPENESEIKQYVKEQIQNACRERKDETIVSILEGVEPIPLSAEMALLSYLPMSKIANDEAYKFAWDRHCSNWGIGSQAEMLKLSHIDDLTNAIKSMINNEKGKILFTKPYNSIIAAGQNQKTQNTADLQTCEAEITILNTPDDELVEKQEQLTKAIRRIQKKIDSLGEDLESDFASMIRTGSNQLEDLVDASCRKMNLIVDGWGRFQKFDAIKPQLEHEIQILGTRTLKRACDQIAESSKLKVKSSVRSFFDEAEEVLIKYIPDFDSHEFVKSVQNKIELDIDNGDIFKWSDSESEEDSYGFFDGLIDFATGFAFGIIGIVAKSVLGTVLSHGETASNVKSKINEMSASFDAKEYLCGIEKAKNILIEKLKNIFITKLLEPMQKQVEECIQELSNKQAKLQSAKEKFEILKKKKIEIYKQIEEVNAFSL